MKILIIDDIHRSFIERLTSESIDFDYQPEISVGEVREIIDGYEGLVVRSKLYIGRELLDRSMKLRFIARAGAGMDNIDVQSALDKGIHLINAPEGNRTAVAEHMVGMLLSLMHRLQTAHQEIVDGNWLREENRGFELSGRTVGLIGYGNNGHAMGQCLAGFGVQVLAYDKYKTGFSDQNVTEVDMDALADRADVLSLHVPLTEETRGLVDQEFLKKFKKPLFFLNGSRGSIVDIPSILEGLESQRILGAAFDVLPVETFPELQRQPWFEALVKQPHVLLSPHVAGWTQESYMKISKVLADKVIRFCEEKILQQGR